MKKRYGLETAADRIDREHGGLEHRRGGQAHDELVKVIEDNKPADLFGANQIRKHRR